MEKRSGRKLGEVVCMDHNTAFRTPPFLGQMVKAVPLTGDGGSAELCRRERWSHRKHMETGIWISFNRQSCSNPSCGWTRFNEAQARSPEAKFMITTTTSPDGSIMNPAKAFFELCISSQMLCLSTAPTCFVPPAGSCGGTSCAPKRLLNPGKAQLFNHQTRHLSLQF
jgi:hypothetical protein